MKPPARTPRPRAAPRAAETRLFLSYRRNDSIEQTNRLDEALGREFPGLPVFIDRREIPGGADFERTIVARLRDSRVVLVLIGPAWAGPLPDGRRRIDDEHDTVRRECELALAGLERGHHIVPVLVAGATMPAADELPTSLRALGKLNALPLRSGSDQPADLRRILARVRAIVDDPLQPPARPFVPRAFDGEDAWLGALQASFSAAHQTLQALLAACSSQVDALRHQAESLLVSLPLGRGAHPAWALLRHDATSGLSHLDRAIDTELGARGAVGNLTGRGELRRAQGAARLELEMALRLGDAFNATARALQPVATVGWVYYTSRQRFIHIHPWTHSRVVAWSPRLLQMDFFARGLPRANPGRQVFWTAPYEDHYGKGMMVTVAAPVYRGRAFLGTVAIDLGIGLLNDFVAAHRLARGPVFVADAGGALIAAPGLLGPHAPEGRRLADALPPALAARADDPLFRRAGTWLVGGHVVLVAPIAGTGWALVHVCERPEPG
jgi:hypothetical protein